MKGLLSRVIFNKTKIGKGLKELKSGIADVQKAKIDAFEKITNEDVEELKVVLENVMGSVNNYTPSPTVPSSEGNVGDIKVVKTAKNKYDLFIKGEDSWHKDTNSSFNPIDKSPENQQFSAMQNNDGTIDYSFNDVTRLTIDLDAGTVTGVATPVLKASGNLKLQPTGTTTVDSTLAVSTIAAADSDTDKFLVSDNGTVKYRTGTEVLSDIGAGSGDITGVTITTDSGSGSKASDTAGSADFSLLGSNGVGITNSGTTITAVAVPAEIDHDSLNNFAANEHIDWTGASAGTVHATNYTNTTYSEATGSAEGLMSIAHHDKLDGIETSATADQTKSDIDGLAITTVGALDTGSIASGFGAIDNGSSNITTTGTISGGTINGSAIWQEWVFNTNRGVADRYYYRDTDDLDDWRRWDAYETLAGSNIVISSNEVPGQFVIPEDCTIKAMYGQIMNSGSTSCPTITIWYGNPSDGTIVGMTSAGAAQPNSGSALVSLKGYEVSKTDFSTDLSAGDIVIPTVHYGAGSLQSYIGSLTVKFITR